MDGLYQLNAAYPFTRLIRVSYGQEVTKIINKTLDGSRHIQIIGEPSKNYTIEFMVNEVGKGILMNLDATGEEFKLRHGDTIETVKILEMRDFETSLKGYYTNRMVVG